MHTQLSAKREEGVQPSFSVYGVTDVGVRSGGGHDGGGAKINNSQLFSMDDDRSK